MIMYAIAIFISSLSVIASVSLGVPLWIVSFPLLFALQARATIVGAITMGVLIDSFSGHPFGTVTLVALVTTLLAYRIERYIEKTPPIVWLNAFVSTFSILFILATSRLLVATAQANDIATAPVFLLALSPYNLLAIASVALGVAILSGVSNGGRSHVLTPRTTFYA